jgi:polar amino acid transport system substrate-binding protein
VANRRFLDERLQEELLRARRSSQSFSIILVDVDYFKQVNDRYGHTAGDKVLQEFAELLRRNLRTSDFVARFGGEEFMLILPDTTLEGAASFAERLRQNIQQTEFHALPERMTASFGVALSRPDDEGEALIKRADAALYTAKTSGRNQTVAARMH